MPNLVRTQAKWIRTSGAAGDNMTNTVYTWSDGLDPVANAGVAQTAFHVAIAEDYGPAYLGDDCFSGAMEYTSWEVGASEAPILFTNGSYTPAAFVTKLPTEVACCVSFQAEKIAGLAQARRRGRIYLPNPTDEVVVDANLTVWNDDFVTAVANEALAFKDACLASDVSWAVFSPTIYAIDHSIFAAHSDVISGWVDNEPDTQRRRGLRRGTKTLWGI